MHGAEMGARVSASLGCAGVVCGHTVIAARENPRALFLRNAHGATCHKVAGKADATRPLGLVGYG